jgi:hypothetical protein
VRSDCKKFGLRPILAITWTMAPCAAGRAVTMSNLQDFLSDRISVKRIVFAHVQNSPMAGQQTNYYVGMVSSNNFLLIQIPSPEAAAKPIDGRTCRLLMARTSTNDFSLQGSMLFAYPREQTRPTWEQAVFATEFLLRGCLHLGCWGIKNGSVTWEGDNFAAEILENPAVETTYEIRDPNGKEVSPERRERFLAKIKKRAGNVNGTITRECNGNVTGLRMNTGYEVRFEYADTADKPEYIPSMIQAYATDHASRSVSKLDGLHIYAVELSDTLISEDAFYPEGFLQPGTFAHGYSEGGRTGTGCA